MAKYPDLYFKTHEAALAEYERRLIDDEVYHLEVRPWRDPFVHDGETYVYRVRTIGGQMSAEARADLRAALKSPDWLEARLAGLMSEAQKVGSETKFNAMISYPDRMLSDLEELAATPEPPVQSQPVPLPQRPGLTWKNLILFWLIMVGVPSILLLALIG